MKRIYKYQNKVECLSSIAWKVIRHSDGFGSQNTNCFKSFCNIIKIERKWLSRWSVYSSLNKLYIEIFSKWNIKSSKKKNLFCCSCSLFIIQTWFVPILTSCFIQNKGLNLLYNETRKHMMHSLDAREFTLG